MKLIHVVSLYPMTGDTLRRCRVAQLSWIREFYRTGKWIEAWLDDKDLKRSSKDVGDPRGCPFVKDLISHAAERCQDDNDIIVLTNTDSCFVHGVTERIIERAPVYSHRREFPRLDRILTKDEAMKGRRYLGNDLFAFARHWWNSHRDEMPDALASYSGWDGCLRLICQKYGGIELDCAVVHESHMPFWAKRENRQTHPGQLWNAKVNRPFLLAHGWSQADVERFA